VSLYDILLLAVFPMASAPWGTTFEVLWRRTWRVCSPGQRPDVIFLLSEENRPLGPFSISLFTEGWRPLCYEDELNAYLDDIRIKAFTGLAEHYETKAAKAQQYPGGDLKDAASRANIWAQAAHDARSQITTREETHDPNHIDL